MADFGYPWVGGSQSTTLENRIKGSWFTAPITSTITSVSVYLTCTTTNHKVKTAVYAWTANNNAGALLGSSDEVTVTAGTTNWVSFNFSTPVSVTSGTKYFLVVWTEATTGDVTVAIDAGTAQYITTTATYGAWPDPLTGESGGDNVYSIYATLSDANTSSTIRDTQHYEEVLMDNDATSDARVTQTYIEVLMAGTDAPAITNRPIISIST